MGVVCFWEEGTSKLREPQWRRRELRGRLWSQRRLRGRPELLWSQTEPSMIFNNSYLGNTSLIKECFISGIARITSQTEPAKIFPIFYRILTTAPCSRVEGAPRGKQTEVDRRLLLQQSLAQVESWDFLIPYCPSSTIQLSSSFIIKRFNILDEIKKKQ